jgi:predicted polyphosphate/ATP-dependent NAD kinase
VKSVGIIANPASGKDIRRLVAHGSVFDNQEKINIVRRVLTALESVGVNQVWFMPDYAGLGIRAAEGLALSLKIGLLPIRVEGTQNDSTSAAALLAEMDAGCLITLGGDGTNRVVAKACSEVPLVPISTGTNNVFPFMVEGTVAGLAAGIVAGGLVDAGVCRRAPKLELLRNGQVMDLALIDVLVTDYAFTGVRAVWEADAIREIFLTRSRPSAIGFSAVGGYVCPLPIGSGQGLHLTLGSGQGRVRVPIAPGLLRPLPIASYRIFRPGEGMRISQPRATIALDGEREITTRADESWSVRLNLNGPLVVDIDRALESAVKIRLFYEDL